LFCYAYKDQQSPARVRNFERLNGSNRSLDFRFSTRIGAISSRLSGDSRAILFTN
jgi:hypothetical protein